MLHNVAVTPDTLKDHWSVLVPEIKDRWPKLTDEELQAINGDLDRFVAKIDEKYGQTKAEVMNELTTLLTPAEKTDVGKAKAAKVPADKV